MITLENNNFDDYVETANDAGGDQMGKNDRENTSDQNMAELMDELPSRHLDQWSESLGRSMHRNWLANSRRSTKRIPVNEDNELDNLERDLDLDNEENTPDEIDNALRTFPTTLSRKIKMKHRISCRKSKQLTRRTLLKYWMAMAWQRFRNQLRQIPQLFQLWRSHLMVIEGRFGSSVVSYFIFLKWVLFINIPIFLLAFCFLVIPQILYRHHQKDVPSLKQHKFSGKELLTGTGYFENSEMYYGFYTNETVEVIEGSKYQMKFAYLFTFGGYYLFCLILLGYSYLKSYRKYYIEASATVSLNFFSIAFCGWDYGITSPETKKLKHQSCYNEIKENLEVKTTEKKTDRDELVKMWLVRVLIWIAVIAILGGSGYATYMVSTELSISASSSNKTTTPGDVGKPLVMPIIISTFHLVIPMIFTFLESFENYSSEKIKLYVHMFRDMFLKATMMGVLVYFWFEVAAKDVLCWETFIGQEIYRLVIVDLFFTIGYSFLMEFIRKLVSLKVDKVERAEFAVGRHTLELIYGQALCWFGVFYSPLLPVVIILKLILIFYVKRYSVVENCKPSVNLWQASRTHTLFVFYLFSFFILTTIAMGCSIVLIEPSKSCGPYQNKDSSYQVFEELIDEWKSKHEAVTELFRIITSPGFVTIVLFLFSTFVYYTRTVMTSHRDNVRRLKTQLHSEGTDKKYLLNLLNQVQLRGKRISSHPGPKIQQTMKEQTEATPAESRRR